MLFIFGSSLMMSRTSNMVTKLLVLDIVKNERYGNKVTLDTVKNERLV